MDCSALDAALQRRIDNDELAGVAWAVAVRGRVLARRSLGWADREAGRPMGTEHLFRAFSNTKLVTSCAALALMAQGRFAPGDPVARWLPELADLRVLRPGATALDQADPAPGPVTVRHLLTHTAGFTYGFLDPDSLLARAYREAGMADPRISLAEQVQRLGRLPLRDVPGRGWHYGVSTDVLGRLLEVVEGEPLDAVLQRLVLDPLGMHDTGFTVPPGQGGRLPALYIGDLQEPSRPGLRRADHLPWPGAYLQPVRRLNPGGGMVTSLDDWMRLLMALAGGGAPVLPPQAMAWVWENQLPAGLWIGFPGEPVMTGRGHSYAGSVTVEPTAADPAARAGDLQWGGMAGTHWWIDPSQGLACALMTQRHMGYGLPFWAEFRALLRQALAGA